MSWEEVAPATALAVSLNDAKTQCRVVDDTEDAYLTLLIQAATNVIESKTRRAFIKRSFRLFYDEFPSDGYGLEIPIAPLVSITHVKYYGSDGLQITIPSGSYDLDNRGLLGKITHSAYSIWPTSYDRYNAVEVQFIAGYGDSDIDVPAEIRAAILFLVAHFYANREPVAVGTAILANKIPFTLEYVLNSFKIVSI